MKNGCRGFTLAEMIMAIAMLAFFSVFIVQMFAKEKEETKVVSKENDSSTSQRKTEEGMLLSFRDILERIRELLRS